MSCSNTVHLRYFGGEAGWGTWMPPCSSFLNKQINKQMAKCHVNQPANYGAPKGVLGNYCLPLQYFSINPNPYCQEIMAKCITECKCSVRECKSSFKKSPPCPLGSFVTCCDEWSTFSFSKQLISFLFGFSKSPDCRLELYSRLETRDLHTQNNEELAQLKAFFL